MQPSDLKVEVRNKSRIIVGEVPTEELRFTFHKMYANIGIWKLELPATHTLVSHLETPGSGVVISLKGKVIASGPTLEPKVTQRYDDPKGVLTFSGVTDNVYIQDALAWPDPGNVVAEQTQAWDKRSGPCETLMHAYVSDNIGPTALAGRQKSGLTMGTDGARGKTVTRKPRFNNLGRLVAGLAKAGRLGFEIIQVGTGLEFRTYAIQDKSATVILDVEDGSITQSVLTRRPLAPTNVVVGGRGHGVKRKFKYVSTTESNTLGNEWDRQIEVYMDYRGGEEDPSAADLVAAGQEYLDDEHQNPVQLVIQPAEAMDYEYGTDWDLGDKIKVKVRGVDQVVTATGLLLKADENGVGYAITLGDPTMADGSSGSAGMGVKTQRSDVPGKAHDMKHWSDHNPAEIPDLTETTLDGVDYVVDHRVLLLENGQTVQQYQDATGFTIQIGTIVFEKV